GLSTDSDSEQLLTQIARTAGENLEESRRIVAALTPAALEEQPLVAALDRLATRLEEETGISTHLETTGVPTLAIEQEIAMLRVAQSALANVRQHSAAQQVQISVSADDDILTLSVIDDGHGFDAQRKPDSESGYGLAAMRTRLAELGGHLEVSTSTTGTTLLATVPILRVS
ncbi:MAG TPA: ATP-binding protein, partial [Marmoricola sp.]|nr:ATP-binding protein [Marmoricola sp.]